MVVNPLLYTRSLYHKPLLLILIVVTPVNKEMGKTYSIFDLDTPISSTHNQHATKSGQLYKELCPMLYAFGDDPNPHTNSINLVEHMVLDYLHTFLTDAQTTCMDVGAAKVRLEDVQWQLRRDQKKMARVEELLFMNEELKKARRAFEMDEGQNNDEQS